jgi:hypothetical protein
VAEYRHRAGQRERALDAAREASRVRPRSRFAPIHFDSRVLQHLGLFNCAGDSGGVEAWWVLTAAVADRLGSWTVDGSATRWFVRHGDALAGLGRCWRVEAARHDLVGLWGAIDGEGSVFNAREGRYNEASVVAAEAAVKAWDPRG